MKPVLFFLNFFLIGQWVILLPNNISDFLSLELWFDSIHSQIFLRGSVYWKFWKLRKLVNLDYGLVQRTSTCADSQYFVWPNSTSNLFVGSYNFVTLTSRTVKKIQRRKTLQKTIRYCVSSKSRQRTRLTPWSDWMNWSSKRVEQLQKMKFATSKTATWAGLKMASWLETANRQQIWKWSVLSSRLWKKNSATGWNQSKLTC